MIIFRRESDLSPYIYTHPIFCCDLNIGSPEFSFESARPVGCCVGSLGWWGTGMDTCTAGACAWSVQVAFLVFGDICHEHVVATSGCSVLGLIATVNASCQVQSCTNGGSVMISGSGTDQTRHDTLNSCQVICACSEAPGIYDFIRSSVRWIEDVCTIH